MTLSCGKRRVRSLTEVWQFKQSELTIFLIQGFFTLFSCLKAVRENFEIRADLNLMFFPKFGQYFFRRVNSKKNIEKKHLCHHDKNCCYFWKSNIPGINLIVSSINMIKASKNTSLPKIR